MLLRIGTHRPGIDQGTKRPLAEGAAPRHPQSPRGEPSYTGRRHGRPQEWIKVPQAAAKNGSQPKPAPVFFGLPHCTGSRPIFPLLARSGVLGEPPSDRSLLEQRKKQIGSLRDESQWIVAQRPLSHLQYPDTAGSSVQDFPSAHMDETQPRALQRAGGERLTSAEAFTSVPVCTRTRESPLQHGSPLRGVQLYSNRW